MNTIGSKIAYARKRAGMTQEELALRVGYKSKASINKIELGVRDLPQKKIVAFADALNVSPSFLMGWDTSDDKVESTASSEFLSPEKQQLLSLVDTLSDEQCRRLAGIIEEAKKLL